MKEMGGLLGSKRSFSRQLFSIQKRGKKFINPHLKELMRKPWHVLLWKLGVYNESKKRKSPPKDFLYPLFKQPFDQSKPNATWVGHSTFLLQFENTHFLSDPVWSQVCSPLSFIGPKRRHDPGLMLNKLPKIDFVLISHNHYDHLDRASVKFLAQKNPHTLWIVPFGLKRWFKKVKVERVVELSWGEEIAIGNNIKICATPAQHFSGRGIFDSNQTLWNGYVVEFGSKKRLYFAGDTGYNSSDFKKIGKKWKKMDLSLIPIGTYVPKRFMRPVHVNPHEAVQIHKDVGSKLSIGMHWKTFRLSDEPLDLPPYDLYCALENHGLSSDDFTVLEPGFSINW